MDVVVKRSNIQGTGVFAAKNFKKGETVIKWSGKHLTKQQVDKMTAEQKRHVSFYKGIYTMMNSPEKYVNHSCDANTFSNTFSDIAKRNIRKGEEITGDYIEDGVVDFVICRCGSKKCKHNSDFITLKIVKELKDSVHPSAKDKTNHKKFIDSYFPGATAYGTRNPIVRTITKKYLKELKNDKKKLLEISEKLWKTEYMEPRIVAAIFVGKIISEPRAIKLVKKWVPTLDNWANCDMLMGETKQYWIDNPKETLRYSKKLVRSKNPWDRRFGLIILIFPVRRGKISKQTAMKIASILKDDREKYVRKGYIWLLDQISKAGPVV